MGKLNVTAVRRIMADCLFMEEELEPEKIPGNAVVVEGIIRRFGFHKERLESHREEVAEMLAELPDAFMADKGGGWSFLQACNDRHGKQWGEHRDMEELFCLGIGLGLVKYCIEEKEAWAIFPGSVPYLVVDLQKKEMPVH